MSLKNKKLLNQILKLNFGPKLFLLGPILFLSFNSNANLINKNVTAFSWVPDQEKPLKGKCYEYDIETGGKVFQALTNKSKCKPEDTIFHWVPSSKGIGGKCYEVDRETKGSGYASVTTSSNCVTEQVNYIFELKSETVGECYQVDGNLKRKVSKEFCAPKDVTYHWLGRENGWGGKCFAIDSDQGPSGYIESVKKDLCKPDRTTYILNQKKEGQQGYCYEVAVDGGERAYSKRVSRSKCFDNTPKFMWQRDSSGVGGECLEVRNSIGGKMSSRKVDFKKCIDFDTKLLFRRLSSHSGICLLIDSQTNGEAFSKSVVLRRCRELVKEFDLSIVANEFGKPICVESDSKTNGNLYIKKVSASKCEESEVKPRWVLDEDGWKGNCVERRTFGDKVRDKLVSKEECRPAKTKIVWHNFSKLNGKCFEVDSVKGNDGFVKEAALKKCAPKFFKYIFYRKDGDNAGNCYLVDRETSGEKFNKRVRSKKCRENLIKVPN